MTKIIPLVNGCNDCPYGKLINDGVEYECELTDMRIPYDDENINYCMMRMLKQCPLINLEDITNIRNYLKVVRSIRKTDVIWKSASEFFSKLNNK